MAHKLLFMVTALSAGSLLAATQPGSTVALARYYATPHQMQSTKQKENLVEISAPAQNKQSTLESIETDQKKGQLTLEAINELVQKNPLAVTAAGIFAAKNALALAQRCIRKNTSTQENQQDQTADMQNEEVKETIDETLTFLGRIRLALIKMKDIVIKADELITEISKVACRLQILKDLFF